jgi:hypothetical protein
MGSGGPSDTNPCLLIAPKPQLRQGGQHPPGAPNGIRTRATALKDRSSLPTPPSWVHSTGFGSGSGRSGGSNRPRFVPRTAPRSDAGARRRVVARVASGGGWLERSHLGRDAGTAEQLHRHVLGIVSRQQGHLGRSWSGTRTVGVGDKGRSAIALRSFLSAERLFPCERP